MQLIQEDDKKCALKTSKIEAGSELVMGDSELVVDDNGGGVVLPYLDIIHSLMCSLYHSIILKALSPLRMLVWTAGPHK